MRSDFKQKRVCFFGMVLLLFVATGFAADKNPNVLFIAVDDLNDWAGYRGTEQAVTPNMDRLAEQGTWFSNAYCQYPLCGPSRASVMSGVYYHQLKPDRLQIKDTFVEKQAEAMDSQLLHAYFKDHGYKTMAVGKILHHYLPKKNLDVSGGRDNWDFNEDANGNRIRSNWPPDRNPKTAKTLTDWGVYVGKKGAGTEADMSDSRSAEWAVARLSEKHETPFMLMVGFLHPHVPWYVPQKYFDLIDPEKIVLPPYRADDLDDVPPAGRRMLNDGYPRTEWAIENDQWRDMVHAYLANIAFVDTKIGQVLDALESSPYGDNTIIVLWSDHGYHMGEKNTFQKHTLWNRSAEAPLIIRVPKSMRKQIKPGRCDRVVGMIDIYPTLLDLCELPANEVVEGRSLKPLLKTPVAEWDYPAFTFGRDGGKSLRYGPYRYIQYGDGSTELYDHALDPNEWTNLALDPAYEATIKKLSALFDIYKTDEEKL